MTDRTLEGVGVLVTRPRTQADELVRAIETRGGVARCFPVLDIAPFDALDVRNSVARLGKPDIVIFVSRNAVEHGIRFTDGGAIAVIGPATAAAVNEAGRVVDIQPAAGYDSEHLLAEEQLRAVAGKRVRIVRGKGGRDRVDPQRRPLPADDPRQRRPDITLARERLGWEPRVGLREGLEATIPYFAGLLGR